MDSLMLKLGASIGFCRENYYQRLNEMQALGFQSGDFDIASAWFEPEKEKEPEQPAETEAATEPSEPTVPAETTEPEPTEETVP